MSLNLFANAKNAKNGKSAQNGKSIAFGIVDVDHVSELGSPLMTEGLITAHDGIAGEWRNVVRAPRQFSPETEDGANYGVLARWSEDVRAGVFTFDLLEPYVFLPDGEMATLCVREDDGLVPLVTMLRPPDEVFRRQTRLVVHYADLRPDRSSEILAQTTDIVSFAGAIGMLHPERTVRTLELLAVLSNAASTIVLRFKHALACRRPAEYSAQVQPIIQTPAHSAFPQGHATQAFMQAYVLSQLVGDVERRVYGLRPEDRVWWTMLRRQAIRITVNRVVSGVHFPVDGPPGAMLGIALGRDFVDRMRGDPRERVELTFDGNGYPPDEDVVWRPLINWTCREETDPGEDEQPPYLRRGVAPESLPAPVRTLRWLWERAQEEWSDA